MKLFHTLVTGLTVCCLVAPAPAEEEAKPRRAAGIDRAQILKQLRRQRRRSAG